ncbi:MAG: hypothetical protein HQK50_16980 [Oligoflexia bacterium]|nr:hypothetical protein [Oligoflexia bacterium]MBF0367274.1 hypothetical protein [Oligoflexia bacterium]
MKALYVNDNPEETEHVSRLFQVHFSKISLLSAASWKSIRDIFAYDGPFGVVIIEATIKDDNPAEIASKLVDMNGHRPFVFVGPKTFIETRINEATFRSHEANQILYRPFSVDDFKSAISATLDWAQKEEFEQSIIEVPYNDFMPIKLRNFYLYSEIPYDAYLEVGTGKFIKIINKNKRYLHSRFYEYSHRGVKFLYLRQEENLKMLTTIMGTVSERLSKMNERIESVSTDLFPEMMMLQIRGVSAIHQIMQSVGVHEAMITVCENMIASASYIFDRLQGIEEVIRIFPFKENDIAEQSVLIHYVCLGILQGMHWDSNISRRKVGLAAIIHDALLKNEKMIEISTLKDPELLKFSQKEQKEFSEHTIKAALLSHGFTGFSDVDFIIEQHHEHPEGLGFPHKLNAFDITPLAATLIISRRFVNELSRKESGASNLRSIVRKLAVTYSSGGFKEVIRALDNHVKQLDRHSATKSSTKTARSRLR